MRFETLFGECVAAPDRNQRMPVREVIGADLVIMDAVPDQRLFYVIHFPIRASHVDEQGHVRSVDIRPGPAVSFQRPSSKQGQRR